MNNPTDSLSRVILKPKEEGRVVRGHLWIFSNEIASVEGTVDNGEIVSVYAHNNSFLGTGFYNRNSLVSIRIVSREAVSDIRQLFSEKLQKAFSLRKTLFAERESFRFVFSESDFMPGLIIDKYNSTFVMQINSAGMEKYKDIIVSILREEYSATNIFTMHDEYFRRMEGLPVENEILLGEKGIEIISDGDIRFEVNFASAQKTGFFFDQTANRKYIESIVANKTVLDAFCNSGGFGLHALKAMASHVVFLDGSQSEIVHVKENLQRNSFVDENAFTCVCDDVFDYLQNAVSSGKQFDVVMIDPPAFAKNKKSVMTALKGYEKLHRLALCATKAGGFLVSTSCSHHITKEDFLQAARLAASKSNCNIQLLFSAGASPDHPVLPAMPETEYLKFNVYRKY